MPEGTLAAELAAGELDRFILLLVPGHMSVGHHSVAAWALRQPKDVFSSLVRLHAAGQVEKDGDYWRRSPGAAGSALIHDQVGKPAAAGRRGRLPNLQDMLDLAPELGADRDEVEMRLEDLAAAGLITCPRTDARSVPATRMFVERNLAVLAGLAQDPMRWPGAMTAAEKLAGGKLPSSYHTQSVRDSEEQLSAIVPTIIEAPFDLLGLGLTIHLKRCFIDAHLEA